MCSECPAGWVTLQFFMILGPVLFVLLIVGMIGLATSGSRPTPPSSRGIKPFDDEAPSEQTSDQQTPDQQTPEP